MTPKTLKKETVEYLGKRLMDEYIAHTVYRSAANYCYNVGYLKAAKYYESEAEDELTHAKKIQDYLNGWNVYLAIPSIESAPKFKGLPEIVDYVYTLEYDLLKAYEKDSYECLEMDLPTFTFLQDFIKIQTEAVAEASDKVNALELINKENKLDVLYFANKYLK